MNIDSFGIKAISFEKMIAVPIKIKTESILKSIADGDLFSKLLTFYDKEDPGYSEILRKGDLFSMLADGEESSLSVSVNRFYGSIYINGRYSGQITLLQNKEFKKVSIVWLPGSDDEIYDAIKHKFKNAKIRKTNDTMSFVLR